MNIIDIIRREPVLISTAIEGFLLLITEFGVDVTGGQQAAILGFVGTVLAIIVRATVTPTVNLPE